MSSTTSPPAETFRDLALALTDEERRELLRKISRSLSLKSSQEQPIFRHEIPDHELHGRIEEEIDHLGFWRRVLFMLRRIFTTKPHDQAYIEFRLHEMRRRVRSACPAMGHVESHSVPEEVANAAWEVYRAAYPLIPMFLDFWKSGKYLQDCIEYVLGHRIPSARTDLLDFVSMEEMQDAFMETELKRDVRKLVVERMGTYLDDIPDDLFSHLEEGVLPIYYLRPLCLLDYNRFFSVFGFDPGIAPPEERPPFKVAPVSAALPLVEKLFYGLHSSARLSRGFHVHLDLLDRYLELKEQEEAGETVEADAEAAAGVKATGTDAREGAEPDEADQPAYEKRRERIQNLKEQLTSLHTAAQRLGEHIPFPEVVRYYRRDPWHRIAAYLPKLRLRDFHQSYLTMRVLSQLDARFGEVRSGVVARMSEYLFGDNPPTFEYFRPAVLSAPDKLGLPGFRHVRSVTILYNFLRFVYRRKMQETVRILSRILPARQRDSSSGLVIHVAGVEQTLSDLAEFDQSFAPDSDDGKAFFRVRYGVEKDITLHKSYRNIVQQKDREVRSMVNVGREHLRGLLQFFRNAQRTLTDQLRQRYAEADQMVSPVDGLDGLFDEFAGKIEKLEKLMKQVIAMEEGY